MKNKKIGFVGLGRMGGNMARCLHDKGYNVGALFDIDAEVAKELEAELGASPSGKASEVKALVNMVMNINTAALVDTKAFAQTEFGEETPDEGCML